MGSHTQQTLGGMPSKAHGGEFADLNGIFPSGVWPTPVRVLTQNGHFLFIHSLRVTQKLFPGHVKMWKSLSKKGDGSATVTVVCVWSEQQGGKVDPTRRRYIQEFVDGNMEPRRELEPGLMGVGTFHHYVDQWWRDKSGLR